MLASTVATTVLLLAKMVQVEQLACDPSPADPLTSVGESSAISFLVCRSPMLTQRLDDANMVGSSSSPADDHVDSKSLAKYASQAAETEKEVLELLDSSQWKKISNKDGILVKRWFHPKYKRYIYLTESELPLGTETAFRMTFDKGESQPEWNPGMKYVKNIKRLSTTMMLTHQVTSPEAAGLIAPREMLLLTYWSKRNDSFLISYSSTEWSGFKPNDEYIFAHNGPSGFQFSPAAADVGPSSSSSPSSVAAAASDGKPGSSSSSSSSPASGNTIVKWLFNAEFSYSVPSVVMNAIMPGAMAAYIRHWKVFIDSQRHQQQNNETAASARRMSTINGDNGFKDISISSSTL